MAQELDRRFGGTLNRWHQTTVAAEANVGDLPHLEGHRIRLEDLKQLAQGLRIQQATLTASKQEVTRQLQRVMDEGRTVAAFLRAGIREHYGRESEKLVEFGMQPFRGIRRPSEPIPTTPVVPGGEPSAEIVAAESPA